MLKNIAQIVVQKNTQSCLGSMSLDSISYNSRDEDKYYESYKGKLNLTFRDIRINQNSDLDYDGDVSSFSFDADSIYRISFSVKQNQTYIQKFYLLARDTQDRENDSLSVVLGYFEVPIGNDYVDLELAFSPNKTFQSIDFKALIFQLEREQDLNLIMSIKNLKIEKMENLATNENIFEIGALEVEVVSDDVEQFIINDEIFYIDKDKKLEIPEEMDVPIYNINYLQQSTEPSEDVCALINYRY